MITGYDHRDEAPGRSSVRRGSGKHRNAPKTVYTKSISLKEFVRAWADADPSDPPNPLRRVKLREVLRSP